LKDESFGIMKGKPMRRAFFTFLLSVCLVVGFSAAADGPNIGLIYATEKIVKLENTLEDVQKNYRDAIEANGGQVVVLAQNHKPAFIESQLLTLDGLLLPGGIDVDPKYYGEERHKHLGKTDAELDELEFRALEYAKTHGLPVLGVCRGHQIMNVFYGGSLIQDIPSQHESKTKVVHRYPKGSKEKPSHAITIQQGTLLHALLGADRIEVNTFHHQAVKRLAGGFVISARSSDGIVEAMERPGKPLMLGTQFHPEKLRRADPRFNTFFARLIDEARGKQAAREAAAKP
jgi:putative glutamine amidotransferase